MAPVPRVSFSNYHALSFESRRIWQVAFGVHGERVIQHGDIEAAIERAVTATREGRPALLPFSSKTTRALNG